MITPDAIRRMIANVVDPLRARALGVVRRAVLDVLDNADGMARGSFAITDDDVDVADGVELLHPVGVSFQPAKGAEAIILSVGANASNRVAIPFVRGQRLAGDDIEEGEVALFVGHVGQVVHLKADGSVVVRGQDVGGSSGGSVVLKANGDVVVTPSDGGNLYLADGAATKKVALADEVDARLADVQAAFDAHVHPTAAVGAPSPPTPVPGVIPVGVLAPTGAANVYAKG